jgi:hypothetical protein
MRYTYLARFGGTTWNEYDHTPKPLFVTDNPAIVMLPIALKGALKNNCEYVPCSYQYTVSKDSRDRLTFLATDIDWMTPEICPC